MEPISSASAALLALESQAAQTHVGWLARVDGGAGGSALDVGALRERIAERLERAPRFRAVAAGAAPGGEPLVWREDRAFAVERHVAVRAEPATSEEELREEIDRFLTEPLARERPLWQVLVVPRTRGGGAAILSRAHRALLDAHEPGALRDLVFDPAGGGTCGGAGADRSATAAGRGGEHTAHDALALGEFRTAARIDALAAARRDHGRIGVTLRHAAYARTEGLLAPAPPSFLNAAGGHAGGARTLMTARLELGRLQRIARRSGTELHDVVLAVTAGALRRVALAAGEEPANLRALVPVHVAGQELLGDAPCAVVELPVAERTPSARLRAIHGAMKAARGPRARSPDDDVAPPTLLAGPPEELPVRLAMGARLCNLTIPSAQGPELALHVAGARVRALFPLAAAPSDHALTFSTLSYGRHLHVTAAADARAIGGVGRLPVMFADAVEELNLSTGSHGLS